MISNSGIMTIFHQSVYMKIVQITLVGICFSVLFTACKEEVKEEVKVEVAEKTPEHKAYELVQNLPVIKDLQAAATKKNQKVSLQLSKDFVNGKNGYYWFRVSQQVGASNLVKMNVKVRENTFDVTILDEDRGDDLTPEAYAKKYPVK